MFSGSASKCLDRTPNGTLDKVRQDFIDKMENEIKIRYYFKNILFLQERKDFSFTSFTNINMEKP